MFKIPVWPYLSISVKFRPLLSLKLAVYFLNYYYCFSGWGFPLSRNWKWGTGGAQPACCTSGKILQWGRWDLVDARVKIKLLQLAISNMQHTFICSYDWLQWLITVCCLWVYLLNWQSLFGLWFQLTQQRLTKKPQSLQRLWMDWRSLGCLE